MARALGTGGACGRARAGAACLGLSKRTCHLSISNFCGRAKMTARADSSPMRRSRLCWTCQEKEQSKRRGFPVTLRCPCLKLCGCPSWLPATGLCPLACGSSCGIKKEQRARGHRCRGGERLRKIGRAETEERRGAVGCAARGTTGDPCSPRSVPIPQWHHACHHAPWSLVSMRSCTLHPCTSQLHPPSPEPVHTERRY